MLFEYYRKLFIKDDNSIFWGGETVTRYWADSTLALYMGIVAFVMLMAYQINITQARYYRQSNLTRTFDIKSINKELQLVFSILILILGLRHQTVGIDTIVYSSSIEKEGSLQNFFRDSTAEPLYLLIHYILHLLFDNGKIGIFIYSFITIYFIYYGLKKYERDISIGLSIIIYVFLYYFPALNLLRISLAASIVFCYFNLLVKGRYKYFALVLIVVCLIHFSTMIMFLPFGLYLIYRKHRKLALIGACSLIVIIGYASMALGDYLSLINRYSNYIDNNDSSGGVGVMLFIDYLPCLIICCYIIKKKIRQSWADIMICFTISAFIVRLMAYYISVAGRLHTHFMCLTMILLPYWIYYFKYHNKKLYKPMLYLSILWCLLRLHIYFSGYLSKDGIMPYLFIWN